MPLAETYLETRHHELRKTRMSMLDGNLTGNLRSVQAGVSARAYRDGYWGFASAPADGADVQARVRQLAADNARTMVGFGTRTTLNLPGAHYRGDQPAQGRPALSAADCGERMAALHAHCMARYPGLRSTRVMITDEHHIKQLQTEGGGQALARIQRAAVYVVLVGQDDQGAPIELAEIISGLGSLADLDWSVPALAPALDRLHDHLQAKRHAVAARGGEHTVVLAPDLAGMLAHEAMGHPCEADAVLSGAVTADLQGRRVASDLITMVDLAHHWNGHELMCPVYVDDEGTPAEDVTMIERGMLRQFMHSRETAARLNLAPSGNARAYGPDDEPLVRMRNTAILPGSSTLDELIAGVDDGYLLLDTSNGQADATTEFMFGVNLAYEIRAGKLGRAVRDTTLSGSALKVLQSVDGVGSDMKWSCNGYCGKKQPMVVSVGGPSLRARAHLGGE
ncbi:MAG: TldD/PmbA family protein [Rubrivivax sp.]|nr:TldD/PmbA family protein [Rubrivivax sp.]MBK7260693.1 TldD/PmbA family protein [Rubrivivax sp.]